MTYSDSTRTHDETGPAALGFPLLTTPARGHTRQLLADAIDPATLACVLSLLHPTDPLLVAARAGVEVNDMRSDRRRAMKEASRDVAPRRRWRDGEGASPAVRPAHRAHVSGRPALSCEHVVGETAVCSRCADEWARARAEMGAA